MANSRKIRVMISSRCSDSIELAGKKATMSDMRLEMKAVITELAPFGSPLFDCWINEDSPAIAASSTAWEACLEQVRKADIVIILYNGNPGWSAENGDIGICHAELHAAMSSGAAKAFAINLPLINLPKEAEEANKYKRFREYYEKQNLFASLARNGDEVLKLLPDVLHEAVVELVNLGGRETRKGRFDTGDALDWSRLDFADRKKAIESVVRKSLLERKGSQEADDYLYLHLGKADLLFVVHAIPATMSNAAAREMVGRPFHHDHTLAAGLKPRQGGPVHIIACHRTVTEKQAADLLGQPDVVTVDTSFGVLSVDRSSKVQCIFLRNCRDESSTRYAVQRTLDWLERSGEDQLIAKRALSRARIVKAIAEENKTS
jgi:hypothetical protein